jgi:hypothetical protein
MADQDDALHNHTPTKKASLATLVLAILALACFLNALTGAQMEADQAATLKAPLAELVTRQAEARARVEQELGVGAQSLALAAGRADRAEWANLVASFEKAYGLRATLLEGRAKSAPGDAFTLRVGRSVDAAAGRIEAEVSAPALGAGKFRIEGPRPGFLVSMAGLAAGLVALAYGYPMRMRLPIALAFTALMSAWVCVFVMESAARRDASNLLDLEWEAHGLADARVVALRASWTAFEASLPTGSEARVSPGFQSILSDSGRIAPFAVMIVNRFGKIERVAEGPAGWVGETSPSSAAQALKTGVQASSVARCGAIGPGCDSEAAPMADGRVFVSIFPPPNPYLHAKGRKIPYYPWKRAAISCMAVGALVSWAFVCGLIAWSWRGRPRHPNK